MPEKYWSVRECPTHGLISVDDGDLINCPAPTPASQGRCGMVLSRKFEVAKLPRYDETRPTETEAAILNWLSDRGRCVEDPKGKIRIQIWKDLLIPFGTLTKALSDLKNKGVVDYKATTAGTTRIWLVKTPHQITRWLNH